MVPQAATNLTSQQGALLRALGRAGAERIVVYRLDAHTLGVAAIAGGIWTEKPYHISITGARPQDCRCDCPAARHGHECKHRAAGVLALKYHVFAKRPAAPRSSGTCPRCGGDPADPLHEAFC